MQELEAAQGRQALRGNEAMAVPATRRTPTQAQTVGASGPSARTRAVNALQDRPRGPGIPAQVSALQRCSGEFRGGLERNEDLQPAMRSLKWGRAAIELLNAAVVRDAALAPEVACLTRAVAICIQRVHRDGAQHRGRAGCLDRSALAEPGGIRAPTSP